MSRLRSTDEGLATASMAAEYSQRATAGLIVTEGNAPTVAGRSNPLSPGLHTAAQAASWRAVTSAVHEGGGRIFAQLMHGGRLSHPRTTGVTPEAPSAVAARAACLHPTGPEPAPEPRALATDEIPALIDAIAASARRAVAAGFDGVEVHGANGYLIGQFLSDTANRRTDRYGGSVAGRIRFAVEVMRAVVAAVGPGRVGLRLSPGGSRMRPSPIHRSCTGRSRRS